MTATRLQLLVCSYGLQGLERLARSKRPQVEGVAYLVSCQMPQDDTLQAASAELQTFLQREDVDLHIIHNRGLSKNRNHALALATAPLSLLSDDDLDYTAEALQAVVQTFEQHPKADVISFQFHQEGQEKMYPSKGFHHQHPPKGYYISSCEIAFRTQSLQGKFQFNENFGVGSAHFPCGEEDILLKDLLKAGLHCLFEPIYICTHPSLSTGAKRFADPIFLQTKGAVFSYIHPRSWWLRLIKGAWDEARKKRVSPWKFLSNTFKGVCKARRLKLFI
jgi:glycosyltransferase involved in cell wall biosynthesis